MTVVPAVVKSRKDGRTALKRSVDITAEIESGPDSGCASRFR
ncbi:hypothetical protein [Mycolicibacterium goodii]